MHSRVIIYTFKTVTRILLFGKFNEDIFIHIHILHDARWMIWYRDNNYSHFYFMICFCAKISNDINCASYYSAIINYTSALDRMQCLIKSYSWKNRAISTNWPIFYLFMLRYTLEKKENVSTIRMRILANIRNRNKVNYRVERD